MKKMILFLLLLISEFSYATDANVLNNILFYLNEIDAYNQRNPHNQIAIGCRPDVYLFFPENTSISYYLDNMKEEYYGYLMNKSILPERYTDFLLFEDSWKKVKTVNITRHYSLNVRRFLSAILDDYRKNYNFDNNYLMNKQQEINHRNNVINYLFSYKDEYNIVSLSEFSDYVANNNITFKHIPMKECWDSSELRKIFTGEYLGRSDYFQLIN